MDQDASDTVLENSEIKKKESTKKLSYLEK
jgi:hypothetical protein